MFERKPLREDVQEEIQRRIVDGRLPAGTRINETHLSIELGLSRTPLREAMLTMSARGFLVSVMGRGFAVPPLEADRWRDLQEILRGLEPAALLMGGPPGPNAVMELGNLIQRASLRLTGPEQAEVQTQLVTRFSRLALEHSPNRIMREEIGRLQALAAPYWFAAGLRGQPGQDLLSSYRGIYEHIRSGRIEDAGAAWAGFIDQYREPLAAGLTRSAGAD